MLQQLLQLKHIREFKVHPIYKKYWEDNYFCNLSRPVFEDLFTFFERIKSKVLLYVFSVHFKYTKTDVSFFSHKIDGSASAKECEPVKKKKSNDLFEMIDDSSSSSDEEQCKKFLKTGDKKKSTKRKYLPISGFYASSKTRIGRKKSSLQIKDVDPLCVQTTGNFQELFHLISATVLDVGEKYYLSLDLNCDCTELCISFDDSTVYLSALKNTTVIKYKDDQKKKIKTENEYSLKPEDESYEKRENEDTLEEPVDESYVIDLKSMIKTKAVRPMTIVKYFPNDPHLLLTAHDGEINLFNSRTREFTSPFDPAADDIIKESEILCVDFNSRGTSFAAGRKSGIVHVWDFNSKKLVRRLVEHSDSVHIVRYHPNNIYLATGSKDLVVNLWDLKSGDIIRIFTDMNYTIDQIAFPLDGKILASADEMGKVVLWDISKNIKLAETAFDDSSVSYNDGFTSLEFNVNGFALGGFTYKKEIFIWDTRYFPKICYKKTLQNVPLVFKIDKNGQWNVLLVKPQA